MLSAMMKPLQEAVRASRAEQAEEREKPEPCALRLADTQARERRAREALILAQIWWGPYWSVAQISWGVPMAASTAPGPRCEIAEAPPSPGPHLLAAE